LIVFEVVEGEVRSAKLQVQQILPPRQVEGAGLGARVLALLQHIVDVFAGEGLVCEGVLNGASHRLNSMDFAQSDDFLDVMLGIKAALLKLPVIFLGPAREA
jgi:hypothetical protein